ECLRCGSLALTSRRSCATSRSLASITLTKTGSTSPKSISGPGQAISDPHCFPSHEPPFANAPSTLLPLPIQWGEGRGEGGPSAKQQMSQSLPTVYLARHGETAWTISGQHTGLTDLPLTERGERNARRLGDRLNGLTFAKVLTSPLKRAARTCELAGFGK